MSNKLKPWLDISVVNGIHIFVYKYKNNRGALLRKTPQSFGRSVATWVMLEVVWDDTKQFSPANLAGVFGKGPHYNLSADSVNVYLKHIEDHAEYIPYSL